mmetsp:Transcript_4572/g.6594  ORF Transcript_4572/g.6594 Transcript_4572/m.6594 type:complete len:544 (+) Transcript_4572:163-1794(+)
MNFWGRLTILLISTDIFFATAFTTTFPRLYSPPIANWLSPRRRHNHKLSKNVESGLCYHQTNDRSFSSRLWQEDNTRSQIDDPDIAKSRNPFVRALKKFQARPGTYLMIPCVAAAVGWITNWMAVQMIFYPIKFRGIPLYVREEVPLGLLGWQGIVPCKTRPMSEVMVTMVTTQLLSVKEVFQRISPFRVAKLLSPRVPMMVQEILAELPLPKLAQEAPEAVFRGMPSETQALLHGYNRKFLQDMVKALQKNIDSIFDIQKCVQTQMLADRTLLGKLFQKCGSAELDFLTNSGLWFGFLLGLIQMAVALFWDNPWTLSIGGAIVGFATNWLALKWIFEPVNPTRVGPFILQGQFLRRQKEVSKEFSQFFARKILNSEELWKSILKEPSFVALFTQHFTKLFHTISHGLLRYTPEPETVRLFTRKALDKLPQHVPVLYKYMDDALDLEDSLRVKMEQMSSAQFERVLHPIFEEDELTLILAGAFLGLAAGLVQQGLETGKIKLPPLGKHFRSILQKFQTFCRNQIYGRFFRQSNAEDEEEKREQ